MAGLTTRVLELNHVNQPKGGSVVYIMGRDQRARDNHALDAAQRYALKYELPFAVVFCLQTIQATVAREHYQFMIEGLQQLEAELVRKSIPLILLIGKSSEVLPGFIYHTKPQAIFFDMSPLRGPKSLHRSIAKQYDSIAAYEVDTHNTVPVWTAYPKQAIGARVLRPQVHKQLGDYLDMPGLPREHPHAWPGTVKPLCELTSLIQSLLQSIPSNHTSSSYESGEDTAHRALASFIDNKLVRYADDRNDPSRDGISGLSPYLHYGQLSSLQVITAAQRALADDDRLQAGYDVLFEEMLVRKELSDNYCYYNDHYDQLDGAPQWAQHSLQKHTDDPREVLYDLADLESARTHDRSWNAAQRQLTQTGKIHGYMRMYWAKKVLEWSPDPQSALERLLYLNDFYHIDGRDPNGYVGILWSIAGLHDRPWRERPIFGVVRYMTESGLKKKFSIEQYIERYESN